MSSTLAPSFAGMALGNSIAHESKSNVVNRANIGLLSNYDSRDDSNNKFPETVQGSCRDLENSRPPSLRPRSSFIGYTGISYFPMDGRNEQHGLAEDCR